MGNTSTYTSQRSQSSRARSHPALRDFSGPLPNLNDEYMFDGLIKQIIRGYGLRDNDITYRDVALIVEEAFEETKRGYPPTEHEFYPRLMDAIYSSLHNLPTHAAKTYEANVTPCRFASDCHMRYGTRLPSFGPCERADDGCVEYNEEMCDIAYQDWQACLAFDPIRSNCIEKQQTYDECAHQASPFS